MPKRPPFIGIHEYPAVKHGAVHEGGGDYPPFGEDLFQRIVDVNWPREEARVGGVFVSGDVCCYIRYAKVEELTTDQDWQGIGAFDFFTHGHIGSASYALIDEVPTFLLGGTTNSLISEPGIPGAPGAIIMVSHDGLAWTTVLYIENDFVSHHEIFNMVWNAEDQLFYAEDVTHTWSSPDGISWTRLEDDIFEDHVTNPFGLADGHAGYDPVNDVWIHPAFVDAGFMFTICTAFAGGIWMAGGYTPTGFSATATSLDGGETWTEVTSDAIGESLNFAILTMIAAPNEDFEPEDSE